MHYSSIITFKTGRIQVQDEAIPLFKEAMQGGKRMGECLDGYKTGALRFEHLLRKEEDLLHGGAMLSNKGA